MQNKILSVSIASYNVEKYLDKTLSSLCIDDILQDLEVFIVNDGSSDKTASIAKTYCEKYPETFFLIDKKNGGYGSTINASLKVAKGKYYKLLDGDDWFDSENLPSFIKALKEINAHIVYTNFTSFQEPSMTRKLETFPWNPNEHFDSKQVDILSMHGMAIKTNLLQKANVSITEHCFYTDVEFTLKALALCSTAIYLPINVYCYRLGVAGQSVSLKGMLKHIDEHEKISKLALNLVYTNERLRNVKSTIEFMAQRHVNLLILLGDYEKYMSYITFLKKKYPKVKTWEKKYEYFVSIFPKLFFKPISKIKRRKNKEL